MRGRGHVRHHQQVRCIEQRVVARKRFGIGHVERGARDLASVQRPGERLRVDNRPTRGVHQVRGRLHALQCLVADQAARLRRERAVQGHEVRALEQFVERHSTAATRGQELAPESLEPTADRLADAAVADDPDGRPVQVTPEHQARLPRGPPAGANERLALRQPARYAEHQREREIGRRVREHAGRVAHRDAAGAGRVQVHVVHAHGVVRDCAQVRRRLDQIGVHGIGEHGQEPLELRRPCEQLRARRRHALAPDLDVMLGREALERSAGKLAGYKDASLGTHGARSMARARASGKTQEQPARATATVALVANQRAGSNDPERCAECLRSYGATVKRFAIQEIEEAVVSGVDRVVVAGGDGSIAGVAAAAGAARIPVAVVPAGTANDFARRMDLPEELGSACRLAVTGTRLLDLELGWLNRERAFVNVASAGLPAPAARSATSWKRLLGPLAYAVGAVAAGLTAKPLTCLVACDGRELLAGEAWQITVAASGAFGAGATVDGADPTDGSLDVVGIEAGPRLGLIGLAYRLRSGHVGEHPRAFQTRCTTAEVRVPDGTPFNVDGEVVAAGTARFTAQERAFQLVVG